MNFNLIFMPQVQLPHEEGDYVLYNQCDGFHIAEAWFDDGEFLGFRFWAADGYVPDDAFQAWAKLPDPIKQLYDAFADKPIGDLSAHDVAMKRLTLQAKAMVQGVFNCFVSDAPNTPTGGDSSTGKVSPPNATN
jgi:hypothetical protein